MSNPFNEFFLVTTLLLATPILLAATGELMAERAGMLNVGLEGMMLAGAFFGFLATSVTHDVWLGIVAAMVAGTGFAAAMAALSLGARADQIVVGVGINLVAVGLTSFLFEQIYGGAYVSITVMGAIAIPGLSQLPVVGKSVFQEPLLVYVAFLCVPVAWLVLFRTRWGLAIRATGEVPAVTDTAGLSVVRTRLVTTLIAGAMAGLGGAFLSLSLGSFAEGMTSGRGFLAIAAVIFGRWRPWTTMLGCLLFGSADALQLELQGSSQIPAQVWLAAGIAAAVVLVLAVTARRAVTLSWSSRTAAVVVGAACFILAIVRPSVALPPQLWATLPYVLSLLVLAGFVGKSRMPTALSLPYRRELET